MTYPVHTHGTHIDDAPAARPTLPCPTEPDALVRDTAHYEADAFDEDDAHLCAACGHPLRVDDGFGARLTQQRPRSASCTYCHAEYLACTGCQRWRPTGDPSPIVAEVIVAMVRRGVRPSPIVEVDSHHTAVCLDCTVDEARVDIGVGALGRPLPVRPSTSG